MLNTSKQFWASVVNGCFQQYAAGTPLSQLGEELASLLTFVADHGAVNSFIEIGSQDGGTLWHWIQMLELDGHGFVVDLPHGAYGGVDSPSKLDKWKGWLKGNQTLDAVFGNSHDSGTKNTLLEKMKAHGIEQVDFAFVDGDHTYDGVKQDYEMYSPLVRKGGVIAFHDIVHDFKHPDVGVDKFWNELKAGKSAESVQEFVVDWEQSWAGIGLLVV